MSTTAERPPDEEDRLAVVRRYDILDTPPDGAFDRITALAARLCNTPISTISIVDEDRIWFKSTYGLNADQVDREPGLCASAIINDNPYVVANATEDPRTLDNSLVRGELGLRFYVGVPLLTSDGFRLGTLNVIDAEPREPSQEELDNLADLAAIVVDELELRLAARRRVEVEAVREAAELRASLLAGISHEMRTPISVLNGMAALEAREFVDADLQAMMRRQIRQLDWLINQYLDFTALESGRTPPVSAVEVDLADIAAEAAEVFHGEAPIDIEVESDHATAMADPNRVRQIVLEMLNNAIRFSPPDAPVTIRVRSGDDGSVAVDVIDRGRGVPPRDHDRIFGKLYRGRESTGSGIGLYVAQALAEAQRGRIHLRSQPDDGSSFTLSLPGPSR